MLTAFCAVVFARVVLAEKPVKSFTHVLVVRKLGDSSWWMIIDGRATVYGGCPDFDNAKFIWAGYWAADLTYKEMGVCKSIREHRLLWERDPKTGDVHQATPEEMQQAEKLIAEQNRF